ncbi:YoaK family protein [Martelella sp. HB161492]|uniref:YoaK family protein n=1 Tax=Martelella sp. HB161492 TaxID=2720726 RepID=UPI00158FF0B2|nr:YoaK family protein [Martelella sp. HB161492]
MSKPVLASLLSFNGGYVDTMGFVTLNGLFVAHVTGNFVTLGASIVNGTGGEFSKLLAIPVFCLSIFAARIFGQWLKEKDYPVVTILLVTKFILFSIAAGMAFSITFGKTASTAEIVLGMVLVVAMAMQNALHRVHLPERPPSTLMTGTTTQIMLDLADILFGRDIDREKVSGRLKMLVPALVAFGIGCATAALIYLVAGKLCFLVPPALIALSFILHWRSGENF